ncbi:MULTISPECIES: alpha-amylase family protein [unclassified Curtobacterium]|uniref:alpha-amylase family protein n=1 Tax=unclassified Curtobacterium TaxID=257496 RepID=UPI000DA88C3D|nr:MULTISPECIES: alpha-amylase family protein [unclassified Curtobacterium]PZE23900.1 alpha-amylase [Curtobacterium sp. MCBD17_028]PZF58480.1 alpha-amylase [Curtobacterium sp. MCBD17_034]PZM34469.1 alpha-amylase [Curtobacterium sp. MCBD17_031]
MTSWVEHALWWHVYPLGFVGADIRPPEAPAPSARERPVEHRLGRLEAWLDHVVDLGLNGIALGPVFASSTHGYDTLDHFRVDPRLGDEDDLLRLVATAHDRGVRVLLDGVFNHVGRAHPAFRALEEDGPAAPTAGLFRVRWDGWRPGDRVDADVFEGHDQLVALDHGSSATVDLVVDVMTHWLDRGVDGWRLDAAYAVPPAFWAAVLPRVRERHPDAWFSGEVIHGDAAAVVRASTMDSVTQYELWQGIWHGIADGNCHELAHAIRRHDALLSTFVPSTFVGNHDVTRITSAVGPRHLPHALAVLFTVAGVPSVYAGDEYAFRGVKEARVGGDDAVRPAFPPVPPAPADLDPEGRDAFRTHQALVAVRRRHPWLHRAHTDIVHLENTAIVLRTAIGTDAVVTALNIGDEAVSLPAAGSTTVEAGAGEVDHGRVRLAASGWAVLGG